MGKTHKKTDRRQGSIKRARHRDRRMKIGAIVHLCSDNHNNISGVVACSFWFLIQKQR